MLKLLELPNLPKLPNFPRQWTRVWSKSVAIICRLAIVLTVDSMVMVSKKQCGEGCKWRPKVDSPLIPSPYCRLASNDVCDGCAMGVRWARDECVMGLHWTAIMDLQDYRTRLVLGGLNAAR